MWRNGDSVVVWCVDRCEIELRRLKYFLKRRVWEKGGELRPVAAATSTPSCGVRVEARANFIGKLAV